MPTALVTGGSSGIGAAICRSLLGEGYDVISLDRAPCEERGTRFRSIEVDLTDTKATREAADRAVSGTIISHIIHNAGLIRPALLPDVTTDDLHSLTQLHLGAPLLLLQAVLPSMRANRFGRVVLLSSRAALGLPTRSAYSATKAGMIGLARTWALELAADGITVNCVAPGPIAGTGMFHDVVPAGSAREAALESGIPVRRLGRPEDVARAVMFLAAPDAGFITGQTLHVCGGTSVGTLAI